MNRFTITNRLQSQTVLTEYDIIALHFSSADKWYNSFSVRARYAGVRSKLINFGTNPHRIISIRKSWKLKGGNVESQ